MIAHRGLAPYAAAPPDAAPEPHCELCTAPLPEHHGHVVEIGVRGVLCVCRPCAILFARSDAPRFRTVPERVLVDPAFAMTAAEWAALGMPVGLAFCQRDSAADRSVVGYPGPAGVVDAELAPPVWQAFAARTPLAAQLSDHVEALLVRCQPGAPRVACYLVPISSVYDLVARLRRSWRGVTGGDAASQELAGFFAELDRRGRRV